MSEIFRRSLRIGWGDMDLNGHMRNAAYLDAASNVRMMYFAANGLTISDFARLRIGPIALRDELVYRRELQLLDEVGIILEALGQSEDGSRFRFRNTFYRPDGKLAATLTTDGAWMDLDQRRIVRPPRAIWDALQDMTRVEDFVVLPSGVKD